MTRRRRSCSAGSIPVRREVARIAITKLIADGRIHPGRIEEVVAKARAEVDLVIRQAGEQAAYEAGVPGLPAEMIKLLGRLKYRTSYGQNVLNHVVETSHLAAVIAAEIGADVQIAKMGGLLHDIGKAVDHEVEGPHAAIGAQIAQRHNLPFRRSINGIAAHHQEVEYACRRHRSCRSPINQRRPDRALAARPWTPTSSGSIGVRGRPGSARRSWSSGRRRRYAAVAVQRISRSAPPRSRWIRAEA